MARGEMYDGRRLGITDGLGKLWCWKLTQRGGTANPELLLAS